MPAGKCLFINILKTSGVSECTVMIQALHYIDTPPRPYPLTLSSRAGEGPHEISMQIMKKMVADDLIFCRPSG
jgi:hypothetical protein